MERPECFERVLRNSDVALRDCYAVRAYVERLEKDAKLGREIAVQFLPVMDAMRPLVLSFENLKEMANRG